jgi:hypothetical protein
MAQKSSSLERFKKYCSHSVEKEEKRSFWVLASFRLSYRVFKHAPSPKPRQNTENPRSKWPHYFLKRSSLAETPEANNL